MIKTPIGLPLWKSEGINTELKTHNGWNWYRDVKEMYENCIHIIKERLGKTTPKRTKTNNNM
jgi:hypothetical protein